MQVAVLNGVNLNMLGRRDPAQYGTLTLSQLETQIYGWALEMNMTVRCWHTNSEGSYVDMIHEACSGADGLVVNPGAWTHYSYAIRDLERVEPLREFIEVRQANQDLIAFIGGRWAELAPAAGRIGFEAAHLSVSRHAALADAAGATDLVATDGVVEALRLVKDDG